MAMSDNINKLVWGIFAIGALSVALLPVGWSTLTTQYNQEAATNNQTLNRVFGSSNSNTTYVKPLMAVIPGHLASITSVSVGTGFPPLLTINGVGFGNIAPQSGQANVIITDTTSGATTSSALGTAIQSWSESQIVVQLSSNFFVKPKDNVTIQVISTSNGDTATWNMQGWLVAPPVIAFTPISFVVVGHNVSINGAMTDNGLLFTGQVVALSTSGGSLYPTDVVTDQNGNFVSTFTAPTTAQMDTITANSDTTNQTLSVNVVAPVITFNSVSPVVIGQTRTISGSVMAGGLPYANQVVTLHISGGTIPSTVTTGSNGNFSFNFTAPSTSGTYTITGLNSGYSGNTSVSVIPNFVTNLTAQGDSTDNNVTLSATVNQALDGYTLAIINETTGQTLATTTSLTTLNTTITAISQQSDTFVAEVY